MPTHLTKPVGLGVLLLAVIALVSVPADAVPVFVSLCAKAGTITLPGALTPVPIWSFVQRPPASNVSQLVPPTNAQCNPLVAQLPGSVISRGVTPLLALRNVTNGDTVTIYVRNMSSMPVPVSLVIPGQQVVATAPALGTFTREVPPGQVGTYVLPSAQRGTYIYESGTDPTRQVAMGLHGAFIVASGVAGQAYGSGTNFNVQATLVLSEIDPNLHADPLGFNMQNYHPTYWLINGKAHPQTLPIQASAGQNVLLRYLNPSFTHHAMALLGLHQRVIAREAFELPTVIHAVTETIPAGTTADMITTIPAGTAVGTRFPLYNRNMRLTNASTNTPGGMQTRLCVGPCP
jgi:FtsP/CotA-like multicopper oxidase with cupredoxin domain